MILQYKSTDQTVFNNTFEADSIFGLIQKYNNTVCAITCTITRLLFKKVNNYCIQTKSELFRKYYRKCECSALNAWRSSVQDTVTWLNDSKWQFSARPEIKLTEQLTYIFTFIMSCLTNNKRNARKESISFWFGLGPSENITGKKKYSII